MGRIRTKSVKNNIHLFRMRFIKPYVNFNYNTLKSLTPYRKRKIKMFYDELKYLTAQPHYKYKPRSTKRKKMTLEYAGQKNRRGYKFVVLPAHKDGVKPKMDFSGKTLKIIHTTPRGTRVDRKFVPLNADNFAKNYEGEKQRLAEEIGDANLITVRNGASQLRESFGDIGLLMKGIDRLKEKYSETIGDWLVGFDALYYDTSTKWRDVADMNVERRETAKRIQEKNKKARESLYRSSLKENIDTMKARVRKEEAVDAVPIYIIDAKTGKIKDALFAKEARAYRKKRAKREAKQKGSKK